MIKDKYDIICKSCKNEYNIVLKGENCPKCNYNNVNGSPIIEYDSYENITGTGYDEG